MGDKEVIERERETEKEKKVRAGKRDTPYPLRDPNKANGTTWILWIEREGTTSKLSYRFKSSSI